VVAILLAAFGQAGAAPIVQTKPFSGTPDFTEDLTFDKFDDQGGTLTLLSIEVIHTLNVNGGQLILDNDGVDPAVGTFIFGAAGAISSLDVSLLDSLLQPVTGQLSATHSGPFNLAGNVGDGAADYDPSPPDGMQYNGGVKTDSDSGFISSTVFAQYTGAGTYDIKAGVNQGAAFGGLSGIEWAVTPVTSSGEVTVIYNYVPEPATLSLLGISGLAMIRRRRRA